MTISGLPISGGAISASGTTSGGYVPPIPSLPTPLGPGFEFTEQEVKYRYGERYVSEATNRKFLGIPRGVYIGFTPSFSGDVLTLATDTSYGISLARLTSPDDPLYTIDVMTESSVTLDFTDHVVFPVNVILRARDPLDVANPVCALGRTHRAEIVTTASAATDPTEILLCTVTASQTVVFDDPTNRSSPFAHASAPLGYGFMKDGAAEELLAAVALTAEIEAARIDLTGTTQVDLDARLTADMSAAAIASRLGKEIRHIQGDDFLVASSTTTVNISRSFSKFHRDLAGLTPSTNIEGFGAENRIGAITSGSIPSFAADEAVTDSTRNVCAVIDVADESRLIDSLRNVAYGRLTLGEIELTGTLTFNGSTTVTGVGTLFTSEVSAGDIIQDTSGNYYEVATTPVLDSSLTLSVAAIVSASGAGLLRRRFELNMRIRLDADSDSAYSVAGGTTVRPFFPVWSTVESAQFDYLPNLTRVHEAPAVPVASTSVAGRAMVSSGSPEGQAGGVYAVQQTGAQIGTSHVHTINFIGASNAGSGVANVSQRGPAGPPGADVSGGTLGPPGPTGAIGRGYTGTSTYLALSGIYVPVSGVSYSFTYNFPGITDLLFLSGGLASWETPSGVIVDSDDHFELVDIVKVSATQGRLDAKTPLGGSPNGYVSWYLNGTGD